MVPLALINIDMRYGMRYRSTVMSAFHILHTSIVNGHL